MHACCCRFCGASLRATMVDLGMSPLANAYLTAEQLHQMEPFYPLRVYVCEHCWLVQLESFTAPESIFSDYAYFSSYSDSWLQHAEGVCGDGGGTFQPQRHQSGRRDRQQ